MKAILVTLLTTSCILSAQQRGPSWERISQSDANKDGKVSKDEFKKPHAQRLFDRFDTNKDGFLEAEEISSAGPGDSPKKGEGGTRGGEGKKGEGRTKGAGRGTGENKKEGQEEKGGRRNKADNAPDEGTNAPQVKAQKLDSEEFINLGSLSKNTVLVFGSYT